MLDLEQTIQSELSENPALERLDNDKAHITDDEILRSIAPRELKPRGDDRELWRSLPPDDDTPGWLDFASSSTTLTEHLNAQLLPTLDHKLRPLGEYVIGCLNDNGYLYEPVEEIAMSMGATIEEVEHVISALKRCEPAGIGAVGIQESLSLQLRQVSGDIGKIARIVVKDHLDDFAAGKRARLTKKFKVDPIEIDAVFELILHCNPFPGEAFRSSGQHEARLPAIQPDLVLKRSEFGWEVSVKGPSGSEFVVNGYYKKRLTEIKDQGDKEKEEKRHLNHYLDRAGDFIASIEQRRKTLLRIGEYLIEKQGGFILTGNTEFLVPLTRTQLAKDLEMHESTISRATQGKFIQLSNGETVSFEMFFKAALRVQKMIEEILSTENPNNPLSDERIAEILAEKGVHVARRTVNKYRDKTKLLSSRKRRSA
jgi:RNA polymerase sigma-54 factor